MKKSNAIKLAILGFVLAFNIVQAQNYKAPKIDAAGKIMDEDGKHIGSVNKEGVISDAMGMKVAYVDAEGSLVDAKTGKKLGKAEKNGNFVPVYAKTPDAGWSISAPMNGTCLVKDKDGNIKAEVHENYKQFGACAAHCLSHHNDHGKSKDHGKMGQESMSAVYSCPMHADVTSDKPGTCSKCGMALVKNKK